MLRLSAVTPVGPARELDTGSRSQQQGSRGAITATWSPGTWYNRAGSGQAAPSTVRVTLDRIGADRQAVERLVVGHQPFALRRHRDSPAGGRGRPPSREEHIVASGGVNLRHRRRDGVLRAHSPR